MGGMKHAEVIHARILEPDSLVKIRKKHVLYSFRDHSGELGVHIEHIRAHWRVGGLEPGYDGAVICGVEEVRERERLRRLAALQERRAALVEVTRHLRVKLGAPDLHRAGATRGDRRVRGHVRPPVEEEEENGGRKQPDGGARRSGSGTRGEAAQG